MYNKDLNPKPPKSTAYFVIKHYFFSATEQLFELMEKNLRFNKARTVAMRDDKGL
jgi:hypothetical protein